MKKIPGFALLLLLSTLAIGQCVPPPVYNPDGTPANPNRTANWPSSSTADPSMPWDAPDYFGCSNYASSPLPKRSCSAPAPAGTACFGDLDCSTFSTLTAVSTCGGAITGGGIHKFVDTLPGLTSAGANNLGQYIPVAVPDTTTYPGSDYYVIALMEYSEKMHSDLPATKMRGYCQLNDPAAPGPCTPHYLGPTIVATKDRPVRILFRNQLPVGSGGNLFLPVDTSIMGSGKGPAGGGDPEPNLGMVTDGARNPACNVDAVTTKPSFCFTDNRATLHLHGGLTPWISDGTPHQWITPDGEVAYPDASSVHPRNEGVSVFNVPDMPDPGPGAQTFFYTNQQSARLMFYHDHAWGITRLNVYAGEAAGYLVTDDAEKALMDPGGALEGLGLGTPLIIQDRTFVPPVDQLATEDPTWDMTRWGGTGSLWAPHVYMPAQNPGDVTGASGFGRWMYGPWFWPPAAPPFGPIANPYYTSDLNICDPDPAAQGWCQPPLMPGTPNLSVGQEAFNDTPIVNGTAYPKMVVDAKEYRFRILNAANDRFFNLQWYVADPNTGKTEVALKAAEVAAAQLDPNLFPTPDTAISPAGPAWLQIGTEGGFLPAPVVIPNQVTTWIINPTRFDVGNVDKHSLLIAPAERADVVVDFTQYAGKTLILYNDAPAAFPARVATYDYYTGDPDQTDAGGAPSSQIGYGPNTRTIMQVVVNGTDSGAPVPSDLVNAARLANLQAAFAHHVLLDANGNPVLDANGKPQLLGVFESSLDPIIVGQGAYNSAYYDPADPLKFRNAAPRDGYARIADFQLSFNTLLTGNSSTSTLTIPFQPKGMHDEMNAVAFDEYGRMTANIGFESPNPTPGTQNVVLYPYINPPIRKGDGFIARDDLDPIELASGNLQVDKIASAADGTQIWKITHNGVDTHPIHFHLFNVQLLNRVTWDNIIIPPDPNELGWKDTVRVSPLEDTIVALRPIVPKIPFGVPDSLRPLNPAMPLDNPDGFNNMDPLGNPTAGITNQMTDFGWEYVWHCHILGHEEMDMMRPLIANVSRLLPDAPVLSFGSTGPTVLNWTDGTPVDYTAPAFWGNPKNEIGYRVERADDGINFPVIGTALANQITFTDTTAVLSQPYSYRVTAFNAAGNSASNVLVVKATPVVTWVPLSPISFGTPLGAAQLNATASVPGTFAYTPAAGTVLPVGVQTLSADFTPTDTANYNNVTATVTLVVGQSVPVITWATPAPIVYGTALSGVQLNATASVPGTFVYTPDVGAVLNAGSNTLSVAFTPTDTANYTTATASVTLVVNKATPVITWPTPAPIAFGTPLGATQLNASTTIPGLFVYTPPAGTILPGGTQTLSVQFTPTDTVNYNNATATVTLTVTNGGPILSLAPTALTFSSTINVTTPAQSVLVTNVGSAPLRISVINLAGANPGRFSLTHNCPIGAAGLAAGANCTVNVTFTPNNNTARSALLRVLVAAPAVSGSVTLTGTTVRPVVSLSATSLAFGNVPINTISAPQTVTVTNTGTVPLVFTSITMGGANPGRFPQTNNCGAGLAPNASCTVSITFQPNRRVARSATLTIRSNAVNSPTTVTMTGTGI